MFESEFSDFRNQSGEFWLACGSLGRCPGAGAHCLVASPWYQFSRRQTCSHCQLPSWSHMRRPASTRSEAGRRPWDKIPSDVYLFGNRPRASRPPKRAKKRQVASQPSEPRDGWDVEGLCREIRDGAPKGRRRGSTDPRASATRRHR